MQILANILLYAFLAWQLYRYTIAEWDPWMAFTVAFVVVCAVIMTLIPQLHAQQTSPGSYPYDD
jgi:hypothetical protein